MPTLDCCEPMPLALDSAPGGAALPSTARNVGLLAAAQGFALIASMTWIAFASLAGRILAPDPALATLPVTLTILGTAASTLPLSHLMQRTSRRRGFLIGAGATLVSGLLAAEAVWQQSFPLFLVAALFQGVQQASAQYYRYAAAESVPLIRVPRAVSTVLLGGILAAALAVPLMREAEALMAPVTFAGAFLLLALAGAAISLPVSFLAPVHAHEDAAAGPARPLKEIAAQPGYRLAMFGCVTAAVAMTGLMTAAPLAMIACGFTPGAAASAIQWHVLAMFMPGLISGRLIERFGARNMMLAGLGLIAVAAGFALWGIAITDFAGALICVGLGWNFLFVGATTLLTHEYRPSERAKAQGLTEFVTFAGAGVSSLLAGVLLNYANWAAIGGVLLLLVALVAARTWRFAGD